MVSSQIAYTQFYEREASLCGELVRYGTKPGLQAWEKLTPSSTLLAENILPPGNGRALLLGCGHGAAAVALARKMPAGQLWLTDASFIALQMAGETLRLNQVANAAIYSQFDALPEKVLLPEAAAFDLVAINLPKGRKLAQRWLVEAHLALRPGGHLYLAGANDLGVQSAVRDAEALFGTATILAYKKGNRLARLQKQLPLLPEVEWLNEPGILPGTWHELDVEFLQGGLSLCSLPGVFSYERLDPGTKLLLEQMQVAQGERFLDLGCGYGVIGLVAAQAGAAQVDLVDANLLAVASTVENLSRLGITNARALPSDVLSAVAGERYTLIVTNPPFHAGQPVDYQVAQAFIQQSRDALEVGGRLLLVANRFIRYERLIENEFRRVSRLADTSRYHVLEAWK